MALLISQKRAPTYLPSSKAFQNASYMSTSWLVVQSTGIKMGWCFNEAFAHTPYIPKSRVLAHISLDLSRQCLPRIIIVLKS